MPAVAKRRGNGEDELSRGRATTAEDRLRPTALAVGERPLLGHLAGVPDRVEVRDDGRTVVAVDRPVDANVWHVRV